MLLAVPQISCVQHASGLHRKPELGRMQFDLDGCFAAVEYCYGIVTVSQPFEQDVGFWRSLHQRGHLTQGILAHRDHGLVADASLECPGRPPGPLR